MQNQCAHPSKKRKRKEAPCNLAGDFLFPQFYILSGASPHLDLLDFTPFLALLSTIFGTFDSLLKNILALRIL
jgi:hypothetical protein